MNTPTRLLIVIATALGGTLCGCGRWSVERADGPLNGPGSQSPTFVRQKLMPEGWFDERAWSSRSGSKVKVYDVARRVDSFCERLPEYDGWVRLQAYSDGKQLRFAPAKFWIVSIDPIAVIMTPFTVTNPDSHSLSELSGASDQRKAIVSSTLANSYNYGARIDTSASLQWFVVSGGETLSAQAFDREELRLTNKNLVLVLTKGKDGKADVRRASE